MTRVACVVETHVKLFVQNEKKFYSIIVTSHKRWVIEITTSLFRPTTKKQTLRIIVPLCEVAGWYPLQTPFDMEEVSLSWCHHVKWLNCRWTSLFCRISRLYSLSMKLINNSEIPLHFYGTMTQTTSPWALQQNPAVKPAAPLWPWKINT